ncbi:hypothetical protein CFP56_017522 [Quercus suber]|uniref:Uncharacterized protein n=1 Tax=Quercus suber TaxID=58331 RepID=A0AAW0KKQ6_QUESU
MHVNLREHSVDSSLISEISDSNHNGEIDKTANLAISQVLNSVDTDHQSKKFLDALINLTITRGKGLYCLA